jgi:hypothetical protein
VVYITHTTTLALHDAPYSMKHCDDVFAFVSIESSKGRLGGEVILGKRGKRGKKPIFSATPALLLG